MQGEGQVVLLSGEAGIGKSRIIQGLRERLSSDSYFSLRYQCSPYHTNSALFPIIAQLERAAEFNRKDDAATRLDKLQRLLERSSEDLETEIPLIANLLSIPIEKNEAFAKLSPQDKKDRTLETLSKQPGQLSVSRPVLFLFEDIHWVDPTTLELLDLFVSRVSNQRVLAVLTHRPEFHAPWTGEAHVSSLTMNKLPRMQCLRLVENVAGGLGLPATVREQIAERADGVPLFIEELTKSVIESTASTQPSVQTGAHEPVVSTTVPETLKDSLMSRLDRLGSVKELAQIGSVIGREFGHELLACVAGPSYQCLESDLRQLLDAGLIFKRGTLPHATYIFKHALIQDIAYESLLKKRRQELHRQIAVSIEQIQPDLSENHPEIVARHYTEAAMNEPAVKLWFAAAHLANRRFSNGESIEHATQGLALLSQLNDDGNKPIELELLLVLGSAYRALRGFASEEGERVFERALVLSEQLNDSGRYMDAARGLLATY